VLGCCNASQQHGPGFEYELTPLDSPSSAAVEDEIVDNRFTIATDEPHVKVPWRVTALRGKRPAGHPERES
jgi:hypothetical protein